MVYTRMLAGTLRFRPVTLVGGGVRDDPDPALLFMSGNELAPQEDQGVIFGAIQAAPNSTIDQTARYTEKMREVYQAVPEADHSFQLTFPAGDAAGFSGMVAKPYSERTRSTIEIYPEVAAKISAIPGIGAFMILPSPLPGGSNFPVEFVISSTGDPRELLSFAKQIQAKAMESKLFTFSILDLKYDQPQTEVVFDRDKVAALGLNLSQVGADLSTMMGGNYVNRFSMEGLSYKVIPEVARINRLNAEQMRDYYVSGPGRQARAAVDVCDAQDDDAAALAQPFPAAQLGEVPGRPAADPGRDARQGAQGAGRRGGQDFAEGVRGRLRGRGAAVAHGRQQVPAAAVAVGGADFPGARGAVREFQRSVHHPARLGAAGVVGRVDVLRSWVRRRSTSIPRSGW